MKKTILFGSFLMILVIIITGCNAKQESVYNQEDEQSTQSEETEEPLAGQSNQENDDFGMQDLNELTKKGLENENQYSGMSYKTEFQGKDGEIFTSETVLNTETGESKIEYYFVDENGKMTTMVLYKLTSSVYVYSPDENFIIPLPASASEPGADIPLVPLVPSEPLSAEDINNGVELLEYEGYETSDEGEFLVCTSNINGKGEHKIWLDKNTGLIAKQTITTDEGIMEFFDYKYFDVSEDEFSLPEDVPTIG